MSKSIIRTEYLKLKGNMSFKVFTIFFVVFLPVIIFLIPSLFPDWIYGENTYPLLPRDYETTWYFTAYIASWFSMFILSFILIFHITNEYSFKTVRQNIIDGYSRLDFLKSKLYMLLVIAIAATLYVFLVGFFAGLYFQTFEVVNVGLDLNAFNMAQMGTMEGSMDALSGLFSSEPEKLEYGSMWVGVESILSYFVQVLGYLVLAVFIGFFLKKGAVSVIVFFSLFIVETIVHGLFSNQNMGWLSEHLPLRTFSDVLPRPDLIELITSGLESVDTLNPLKVSISIGYILLFLFLTRLVFYKRDVA